MNFTDEVEALKKVMAILSPLEELSRQRVLAYAQDAFGGQSRGVHVAEAPKSEPRAVARSAKPVSPQEYLRRYAYKIMTKRIAVLAVYLEREKQLKTFGFKDITAAFRDAKEAKLPAQSQYGRAVIMGYLGKKGDQYYATSQAENLIDDYSESSKRESSES
jgi:hypothetical protein